MTVNVASIEERGFPWWLVLLDGISMLVLGLLLVISPGQTTVITIQFIGLYWLIGGLFKVIALFIDQNAWALKLIAGVIGIIAGLVVLQHPIWSSLIIGSTLIIILGFQGIIYGGIGLFVAAKARGWGAAILSGISIIFGLALLFNVWVATFSLPWIIGIMAIIGGVIGIISALQLR